MQTFSLDGRVALITGAGQGMGASIARTFAEAGASVALTARTAANVEAVAKEIEATGGRALPCPADVTDHATLPGLVERVVGELGGIDVLVNCAGGGYHWYAFTDTTVAMVEEAFHFTVSSVFELTRLAVPHMLERPGASIVNIGSVTIGKALRGHLTYETAKAALVQLTKSMAADLGPKIRVNIIHPGITETETLKKILEQMTPEMLEDMASTVRLKRNGTPEEIAYAALYLASPAGAYVTGAELHVSGGPVDERKSMFPDL